MMGVEINLALKFRMPENYLNVNGVIMGVRNATSQIYAAIVESLIGMLEEKTIEGLMMKYPEAFARDYSPPAD